MVSVDGKTKITGLIGHPVEHTRSPIMHNSAYRFLGLNYMYIPLHVLPESLHQAIEGVRALQFAGVNVTVPYKETVVQYLDELSVEAGLIGAVNTIVNEGGRLKGYNTDGPGFVQDVEETLGFSFPGKRILVLGAGGAARAVAVSSLLKNAASLTLIDTDYEKARSLGDYLAEKFPVEIVVFRREAPEVREHLSSADLLVNATPVGMSPHILSSPLSQEEVGIVSPSALYYDLIYNPLHTKLCDMFTARDIGCAGGIGMLAAQGARAFELFTGRAVPLNTMKGYLHGG